MMLNIFSHDYSPFLYFFCWVSVPVFCLLYFKLGCLFYCWVVGVLYSGYKSFVRYIANTLPYPCLSFHLLMMPFDEQKFVFWWSLIYQFLRTVLGSQQIVWQVQRVAKYSLPTHMYSLPTNSMACWNGAFVTTHEPILIYHCHPKSIVHIRIHSWYYTFCGLRQM